MQKHRDITLQRLASFRLEIFNRLYPKRQTVDLFHFPAPGRISFSEAVQGEYRPIQLGVKLEPLWSTHWFRVEGFIPSDWQDQEVHFLWDSSSEACVWMDGKPLQGLTGSDNGWQEAPIRTAFPIQNEIRNQDVPLHLYIEAALNGLFGIPTDNPKQKERIGWLRQAELAVFDRQVWNLLWDFTIIADMARELPADSPRAGQALFTANAMANTVIWTDRKSLSHARELAAAFLSQQNGQSQHQLSAIGHAHIDTAWLWPLAETKRKCVRSFSSAVDLMDRYPNYLFVCSQAQQLAWMKNEYPDLYARILEKVKNGQFIPVGATWVEPDTNIPSGESLVRQFLYGQRFFKEEFGEISRVFWEPDVFGYAATLPQLMRSAGVDYFLTQKLSWNEFNKPQRHTFYWEGLDGSQVLAHFPPVDTYNSLANVHDVLFNVSNYKDHDRSNHSYLLFGFGDGGGGPTDAMIEQINRMADVDGLPKVNMRTPEAFFEVLETDLKDKTVWSGELYFENHRGTYTSQARTKQLNRLCEQKLHDVEFFGVVNWLINQSAYPHEVNRNLWQMVLTNQFHDILPGSSIHEVYEETEVIYQQVLEELEGQVEVQIPALLEESTGHTVVNTLGFQRREIVSLPKTDPSQGQALNELELGVVDMPPYAFLSLDEALVKEDRQVKIRVAESKQDGYILENELVEVWINPNGQITRFYEKNSQREIIQPGVFGNQLVLYEDKPFAYEAWNVDVYYLEKQPKLGSNFRCQIEESGPLRVSLRMEQDVGQKSHLVQTISLDAISPRLDFETWVDWQEEQQFLRVLFPLNLRSDFATYEVQYGNVRRPTHFNTPYDLARFEVPAQRWADLSEPDFGVALINDCKYGYACHGNVLSLSLLRAPNNPDPLADRGEHHFRYALYPHAVSPQLSAVWAEAAAFNQKIQLYAGHTKRFAGSFFQVDAPNIVFDTVKMAEDGDGIILRLYESSGSHTRARIKTGFPLDIVWQCDLLERNRTALEKVEPNDFAYHFSPFEILNVHITGN
ncbi:MAG: hypothetical protein CL609_11940 [Anaerolineaceae bacterium]|nr:hypothetical protein [Anaerolineaceae bacterium]